MNLSTEVKTHVIITFNRIAHFITFKNYKIITTSGIDGFIQVGDSTIKMSSISEIVTIEDYYKANPSKRPTHNNYPVMETLPEKSFISESRRKKRLELMKNGFLKGVALVRNVKKITSNHLNPKQKIMYNNLEKKIKMMS